jgi:catalase
MLTEQGAVPRFVAVKMGRVDADGGEPIEVEVSMEAAPSVLWDAMIVVDGAGEALTESGHAVEFLKDQYRHCKTILLLGDGSALLEPAGITKELPSGEADGGLLLFDGDDVDGAAATFVEALTKHRHFERETDPPRV